MSIPFEPTRSYVYKATRYELLPRLAEIARGLGDTPFLLRELSKKVLAETYSQEQLDTLVKKAESEKLEKMSTIFGFYIPFLATNLDVFEKLGAGMFRNVSHEEEDEEIAEAEAVEADAEALSSADGIIYAYSFPAIIRETGKFPIKIGLTTGDDAGARVKSQCKQTCCFEFPRVLRIWNVHHVSAVEDAIHATLKARGSKRDAPGTEWFDTTTDEVDAIIKFVQP